jgi:hypothetical protein
LWKRPTTPDSIASASPRATITAAISVGRERIRFLAAATVTPRRSVSAW